MGLFSRVVCFQLQLQTDPFTRTSSGLYSTNVLKKKKSLYKNPFKANYFRYAWGRSAAHYFFLVKSNESKPLCIWILRSYISFKIQLEILNPLSPKPLPKSKNSISIKRRLVVEAASESLTLEPQSKGEKNHIHTRDQAHLSQDHLQEVLCLLVLWERKVSCLRR